MEPLGETTPPSPSGSSRISLEIGSHMPHFLSLLIPLQPSARATQAFPLQHSALAVAFSGLLGFASPPGVLARVWHRSSWEGAHVSSYSVLPRLLSQPQDQLPVAWATSSAEDAMATVVRSCLVFPLPPHLLSPITLTFPKPISPHSKHLACRLCLSSIFRGNWAKAGILI